ncbi:scavenger mRNA decapping enzyme [Punctularia strigosozonata HHB-11173 SS5]|uniref:scavenger mRNA decapping enzyme n=1 Tax=Punctularia strigosozonata (strain HHB-11173) TaxID=741275 RepID=UPI00044181C5|nr:scavenger mRNA decapping enzyme [Punctularia strigosozonata HHB-11173 SS5]EIN09161.1 scavenger mRNA decapping enzyme [Punctularia strigosozonata HHB-11173 SS5]
MSDSEINEAEKLQSLKAFHFTRVLNDDPVSRSLTVLGTLPQGDFADSSSPAVLRLERTSFALSPSDIDSLTKSLHRIRLEEHTDIYTWLFGWLGDDRSEPDVKISIICPATDAHIRKYSKQDIVMVTETPDLHQRIVRPYMDSFSASRTQWVRDIINGVSEADKILYRDTNPSHGFVLLPDMKWDLRTISSLYLVAIANSPEIRSLRSLQKRHIGMLRSVKREADRIVKSRWGLGKGALRFFIHYQPSYYHFHVHIVNANYVGTIGSTVGQAHLLDDVIALLELDPEEGPSIMERMTFTYGLGDQHGLFVAMKAAQVDSE